MTILYVILTILTICLVLFLTGLIAFNEYRKAPKKEQRWLRADNHRAFIYATQIIKALAKSEIICVARDNDLPTGQAKNNKAVKDIMEALHIAGLNNVPEVIVIRIVEATYQTVKEFIKTNHLDSRAMTTPLPSDMNPDELKKRLP